MGRKNKSKNRRKQQQRQQQEKQEAEPAAAEVQEAEAASGDEGSTNDSGSAPEPEVANDGAEPEQVSTPEAPQEVADDQPDQPDQPAVEEDTTAETAAPTAAPAAAETEPAAKAPAKEVVAKGVKKSGRRRQGSSSSTSGDGSDSSGSSGSSSSSDSESGGGGDGGGEKKHKKKGKHGKNKKHGKDKEGKKGKKDKKDKKDKSAGKEGGTQGGETPAVPAATTTTATAGADVDAGAAAAAAEPAQPAKSKDKKKDKGKGERKRKEKGKAPVVEDVHTVVRSNGSEPTEPESESQSYARWRLLPFKFENYLWRTEFAAPNEGEVYNLFRKSRSLDIVTYNALQNPYGSNVRHDALLDVIESTAAHIVVLQEVTLPLLERLLRRSVIRKKYYVSDVVGESLGPHGILILSQLPFERLVLHEIPSRSERRVLFADFMLLGRKLTVAAVNLDTPTFAHELEGPMFARQLKYICHKLRKADDAVIAGDLQCYDVVGNIAQAVPLPRSRFVDVWPELNGENPGFTFDASTNTMAAKLTEAPPTTRIRLDRVLLRSNDGFWAATEAELIGTKAIAEYEALFPSHHYGVKVRIAIANDNVEIPAAGGGCSIM